MDAHDESIITVLFEKLSSNFSDFSGLYFFGSRLKGTATEESDYDVALIFDGLDHDKRLEIAGTIIDVEYETNVFIDYKLLTTTGNRSIENIRRRSNPLFIQEAIDKGQYYGRRAKNNISH